MTNKEQTPQTPSPDKEELPIPEPAMIKLSENLETMEQRVIEDTHDES